ncbi:hypothetical protein Scep_029170 [Stephania cephalantha]|uniref:Sodium/metabolite cotransporter BASS3, chloroplastic n=1 Tax=Stephania cephalantha TaxID=152367 RepID=A0AAP0DX34_9MAGN
MASISLQWGSISAPNRSTSTPLSIKPCLRNGYSILGLERKYKRSCGLNGVYACSTSSPYFGRFRGQSKEGSFSSFGVSPGSRVSSVQKQKSGGSSDGGDASKNLSAMLPFIVAATAVAALVNPATFSWVSQELYAPALGGIMLSIGIQMSLSDFALAAKRPVPLSVGLVAQYAMKPLLGLLIARSFSMPSIFYAGFVLMACVSGAQLCSYATFLSKGDVAVSILVNSSTTILSTVVTPILTGLLIGSVVPVDPIAMSKSIMQVVFAPITLGLVLNTYAKPVVSILRPAMPFVAMFCTSLCIGSPLAINRSRILSPEGLHLVLPVVMFHTLAFIMGYWASKIPFLRQPEPVCRTISLCAGMQSSTLAGLLATQFLGSTHAVPSACSVVTMAIMGLCIASFWGNGHRFSDIPRLLFPQPTSAVEA